MSRTEPTPRKRLVALVVVLGVCVVLAVLSLWPGQNAAPQSIEPGGRAQLPRGKPSAAIDPSSIPDLKLEPQRGKMQDQVSRNVFVFYNSPTPTPSPIPPTPTPLTWYLSPALPSPLPTPTPIIPPAIPYKAIGMFGSKEDPIVTLEEGNRLINAREGDVLDGRFKVVKINRESVDFGFVGLPPEITRRFPLPVSGH